MISYTLEVKTTNPNNGATGNSRLAAIIRARKRASQRRVAWAKTLSMVGLAPRMPCTVVLTRVAPSGGLDPHDGLGAALKGVIDGISDGLGLKNDRDPRVQWVLAQRRGPKGVYVVEVSIEPRREYVMTERACATCGEEIPPPPESTDGRVAAAHARTKYCSSRCKKRHEKGRLSKAHRLAIASAVAPTLRAARKPRTITTTDAEGNPVRTITDTELALSMLKRADIELSTDQPLGVKPCETCKKPFRVKASNAVRCETCRHGRCPDCSKPHVCLPKPGRSGKCRACWRAKRDADIKARPAKAPCKSCGADLWHAKKHRVRARCVACGHRRKEPTSRACVECAKVVVGYTRRGRCQSCYARLRSATSAREIPPPAEQLGPFTGQGAAICSQSL